MIDLNVVAKEIRDIISNRQKELELTFIEDTHTYFMKDINSGVVRNDFPSVSTVLHNFYTPFPSEEKSFKKAGGDLLLQEQILKEWSDAGDYASNMGSRVHYLLEKYLVSLYGNYKEVRQPIFTCDEEQIRVGDAMVKAGKEYIDLLHGRGLVLLDTEIVLGDNRLGYVGQPDKKWLYLNKDNEICIITTDWKSNKPKNFQVQHYTGDMLPPFQAYKDTALSHYYIQLPLYARLLMEMLKGSKYENVKYLGGVVVLLKEDANYQEYKIPKDVVSKVFEYNLDKIKH